MAEVPLMEGPGRWPMRALPHLSEQVAPLVALPAWQVASPEGWTSLVTSGGVLGFAMLALFGFYQEWWLMGKTHRAIVADLRAQLAREGADNTRLRAYVERMAGINETLAKVAERTVVGTPPAA